MHANHGDNRVTALCEVKVRAPGSGEGLALSPAPSSLYVGLEVHKLFRISKPRETGRERTRSTAEARSPTQADRLAGLLFILRTALTFPQQGQMWGAWLHPSPLKQEMEALLTEPSHLSWSGDINLTVCHFPFGLGPVEAALETPSIKCS